MAKGEILYDVGSAIEYAFFPEGAVISLQTVLENGDAVETASIGCEGAYGVFAALSGTTASDRAVVLLGGQLRRVPMEVMQREMLPPGQLRGMLVFSMETVLVQVQQTVACNAAHTTRQRMARWLLTMHDHMLDCDVKEHALPYTHELMSRMFCTTRKSVTLAAQAMQRAGLITYRRGLIEIVDRGGIEKMSCECYAAVRARRDAIFGR